MQKQSFDKFHYSDFNNFFQLMKEAFPSVERRSYEEQKKLLNEKLYNIIVNKDEKNSINAFLANWQFKKFNFIEHFAVASNLRGHGLGTLMLKAYLNKANKPIFLEVELPENEESIRRIKFYKRLGFHLNDFNYLQPPMQKHHGFLPLKVMSYPKPINNLDFINFKNIVYNEVYKVNI